EPPCSTRHRTLWPPRAASAWPSSPASGTPPALVRDRPRPVERRHGSHSYNCWLRKERLENSSRMPPHRGLIRRAAPAVACGFAIRFFDAPWRSMLVFDADGADFPSTFLILVQFE